MKEKAPSKPRSAISPFGETTISSFHAGPFSASGSHPLSKEFSLNCAAACTFHESFEIRLASFEWTPRTRTATSAGPCSRSRGPVPRASSSRRTTCSSSAFPSSRRSTSWAGTARSGPSRSTSGNTSRRPGSSTFRPPSTPRSAGATRSSARSSRASRTRTQTRSPALTRTARSTATRSSITSAAASRAARGSARRPSPCIPRAFPTAHIPAPTRARSARDPRKSWPS